MRNIKCIELKIENDRIGIAQEILSIFLKYSVSIMSMEIIPPLIQFKVNLGTSDLVNIKKDLKNNIKEIQTIEEIDMMNCEKKEKTILTIINNMSQGIILTNTNGKIEYLNSTAQNYFLSNKDFTTLSINSIIPEDTLSIHEKTKDTYNIEWTYTQKKHPLRLLLDVKTIRNQLENPIGFVIIMREMNEIRKTIQSISGTSLISFDDIICSDPIMVNTVIMAKKIANSDSSVMIYGESGTGKELFARAIHLESPRSKGLFIPINCASIPETLIESEFFGYEKGSFTGANKYGKQGLFELAQDGSIFLDEIGDLPLHLQAKLLRVLQEKKIRRIGSSQEIPINVRIISATHRDLPEMISNKIFREDLFYRLQVLSMSIPPLRQRTKDIPILAKYFIEKSSEQMENTPYLTEKALEKLMNYSWPGNIRELQNTIERAVVLSKGLIDESHIVLNTYQKANLSSYHSTINLDHTYPL
ncbi:MAG: sigma 54-interacting transcriptional regulator, partial [Ignavibacteria bacterium]|nr:sigma 54-interacting transcriptional regulator [Ignavibacteria bacterium]